MGVHGISPADVKEAPTIRELAKRLEGVMDGRLVAIYNAAFDMRMLWQSIAAGNADDRYRWLDFLDYECVMEEYAEYWGQRNRRYGGYKWQSLINACRQQGIKVAGAHDAVGDARMTAALIRTIEKKLSK
jgi:DNA polymerase III epsilon subunit-like protein